MLPAVNAPLQIVVPVPDEPKVGLTVVVFEPALDLAFTAVMVRVTPLSLKQVLFEIASSPD